MRSAEMAQALEQAIYDLKDDIRNPGALDAVRRIQETARYYTDAELKQMIGNIEKLLDEQRRGD